MMDHSFTCTGQGAFTIQLEHTRVVIPNCILFSAPKSWIRFLLSLYKCLYIVLLLRPKSRKVSKVPRYLMYMYV